MKKPIYIAVKILLFLVSCFLIVFGFSYIIYTYNNLGNYITFLAGLYLLLIVIFEKKISALRSSKWGKYFFKGFIICNLLVLISATYIFSMIYISSKNIPEKNKDVIIVLGAGLMGDRVTIPLAERLKKAAEYFNDNPESIIMVSGGQGANETVSEASAMKKYLISIGVPAEKILIEDKSTSTQENFNFSKVILDEYFDKDYDVVYVTNSFHTYRAGRYAKDAGLDAEGLAAPSKPEYLIMSYCSREYLAVMYYLVFKA